MLQNAEEAIDQGGSLTITTEQVNSSANISISDTGCGIPPDIMKNIFEPFFTTKSAVKGTGLGLSVCHGIVELHGGEIKIDSRTNQGTTVTLVFPLRRN
jgi:signal transduction histidine kinase